MLHSQTGKLDRRLLDKLPFNRPELGMGVGDLYVVHIEKIQVGMNQDGGEEHGKEQKGDLCKCSQTNYGSRPHGNSENPQGSEPISPIKGPRVKEKYPKCWTEARFKGDIVRGLGSL
jgi:hypothetical protein